MKFTLIAAVDMGLCIGNKNDLPWNLPADLAFFKEYTMGKPVIFGGTTIQSLPRALPGRICIHMTRDSHRTTYEGFIPMTLPQICHHFRAFDEVVVAGGAWIYSEMVNHKMTNKLILTHVKKRVTGDAFFPRYANRFIQTDVLIENDDFITVEYSRIGEDNE